MNTFKIGDRVTHDTIDTGLVGEVVNPKNAAGGVVVRWPVGGEVVHPPNVLKLVAPDAPDATDPGYYKFPGGAEVRHISAHLTSFGGQALQYIARSTRLDGNNKGDQEENLRKAILFLGWEIERIQGK